MVGWCLPPGPAKDAREWLTARVRAGAAWPDAGRDLLAHLAASAEAVGPPDATAPTIVLREDEYRVNAEAAAALEADPGV